MVFDFETDAWYCGPQRQAKGVHVFTFTHWHDIPADDRVPSILIPHSAKIKGFTLRTIALPLYRPLDNPSWHSSNLEQQSEYQFPRHMAECFTDLYNAARLWKVSISAIIDPSLAFLATVPKAGTEIILTTEGFARLQRS